MSGLIFRRKIADLLITRFAPSAIFVGETNRQNIPTTRLLNFDQWQEASQTQNVGRRSYKIFTQISLCCNNTSNQARSSSPYQRWKISENPLFPLFYLVTEVAIFEITQFG